jgi:hypothetical protein
MNLSFAMAGLAEAAFAQSLVFAWIAIGIVAILIIAACWKRSLRWNLTAIFFSLVAGMLFGPYETLFGPTEPPAILSDPDYIRWLGLFRVMTVAWILATTIAVVIAFVGKFPLRANLSQSDGPDASAGESNPVIL